MDWRYLAACTQTPDPELFFPVADHGPALRQIAQAKTTCRGCPVITECLHWALRTGQDYGIWGGMTPQERRALKRRDRIVASTPATTALHGDVAS